MFVLELFDCGNGRKLFTYIHLALSPELLNNHFIVLSLAEISFSSLGPWQSLSHSMLEINPKWSSSCIWQAKKHSKRREECQKNPSITSFGK